MAVPTHVGSNTQDTASGLNLTFTVPASTITNDLMICFVKQSENTNQRFWDDDGGGVNGWTLEQQNRTTGGRDMETAIFWKFATSGAEPNPTFTWGVGITGEPMSGIMEVYRGVDTAVPFGYGLSYQAATDDANPPNPPTVINSADTLVLVFHGATHDDISVVAPPTGFTMLSQVWNGLVDDHRNVFSAALAVSTIGSYTPPDWQHTVLNTTPEYHTYTVNIQGERPIYADGGTGLSASFFSETGKTLTGAGFEAAQGAGKVELWSDFSGTIKVSQTIVSWADLAITFDPLQGALNENGFLFLAITNDSGDSTALYQVQYGILSYTEYVTSILKPDHVWDLDNDFLDTGNSIENRPMDQSIVGSAAFETTPLVDSATHSLLFDDTTQRREILDSTNMNISPSTLSERTITAWIKPNTVQKSLSCIWKEGGGVQNLTFFLGVGNVLVWQLADLAGSRDNVQAYSDFKLTPGRTYNITGRYSHTDVIKESRLYVDGKIQTITNGNPMTLGIFDNHSGDVVWGRSDVALEVGGVSVTFDGPEDCNTSHWASWSDNSTGTNAGGLEASEIFSIFERGALAVSILSGTEAEMQTALDLLADTTFGDVPLAIQINRVDGGGDLELVADNINFNSRGSLDIQYLGITGETLTWVNSNGGSVDITKTSNFKGGSITFAEDVTIKVTARDVNDNSVIPNARVLLLASSGGDLTEGTTLLSAEADGSGAAIVNLRFTNNQPVIGRVRKSTSGTLYKSSPIDSTVISTGLDLTIYLIKDE